MRRTGRLHRNIGQLRQCYQFIQLGKGCFILTSTHQAAMIQDHFQIGMRLSNLAKLLQEQAAHAGNGQAFLLRRRPQPIQRAVAQPHLFFRVQ